MLAFLESKDGKKGVEALHMEGIVCFFDKMEK
jgi:hypothetical protein